MCSRYDPPNCLLSIIEKRRKEKKNRKWDNCDMQKYHCKLFLYHKIKIIDTNYWFNQGSVYCIFLGHLSTFSIQKREDICTQSGSTKMEKSRSFLFHLKCRKKHFNIFFVKNVIILISLFNQFSNTSAYQSKSYFKDCFSSALSRTSGKHTISYCT